MHEFGILGPIEVIGNAGPVRLGGLKQRATLAILLLSANRIVSVERLADDLYAGAPPVTAVTQVQRQISELRKTLGSASAIETRSPGYVMRLAPEQLDLNRFEQQTHEANQALVRGQAEPAADRLRLALGLWRGAPLADLAYEPFAQTSIARLEEIRLAAVEQRIEADLALGRHTELVGELEQLVFEHPLHERFRAQLMLALYRSGRQVEALDVFRRTRAALIEELGIEPTPALVQLERAILAQDPELELAPEPSGRVRPSKRTTHAVLVLPSAEPVLEPLLGIAEPLARQPGRELIVARLLDAEDEVAEAAASLNARRSASEVPMRGAAFTTLEPARDVVRLATAHDVDLVLLDAPPGLAADQLPDNLSAILERSPADVAVLVREVRPHGDGVFVPFGGSNHDWAALELAAWLASATGSPLRLLGAKTDLRRGQRDASRLLADASLAVQRVVGVETQPLLTEPNEDALLAAVDAASIVVIGVSPRWQQEGIGKTRRALAQRAHPATLLVHHGPRPGGLAPRESRTRFTWSIEA